MPKVAAGRDDSFFRPSVNSLSPYQPGKPIEHVKREHGLEHVVKLASNEGPFGPLPAALEAMADAATDSNRYPDGGAYTLHHALAARHGIPVTNVCVGAGADGCIDMLSQAILDPGDEVLCGWPSFPSYVIYARKQGAETKLVPLADRHGVAFEETVVGPGADGCIDMLSQAVLDPGDEIVCGWPSFPSYVIYARKQSAGAKLVPLVDHRYDLGALLEAVTPKTKLVYICEPNNPTGTMNSTDELDAYFERVPEHVMTVVDQAYFEYIDRDDYPDAIERYVKAGRKAIVLRTFSKIYGLAGLRVGYAVGPRRCVQAMAKVRRPFDLTTPAQVAALASLDGAEELANRRALNSDGLAQLEKMLREHGLEPVPSVGNFLYVETGADGNDLFERLLREGIIVRPLAGFGSPTAIRISVGSRDELDMLNDALGRVLQPA